MDWTIVGIVLTLVVTVAGWGVILGIYEKQKEKKELFSHQTIIYLG